MNNLKYVIILFIWLLYIEVNVFSGEKSDFHPRFSKLVNRYQLLQNYFAKSKVNVITNKLANNEQTIRKQEVFFELGYSNQSRNLYFEKSHLKTVNSEQNINIISDGKNIYKYIIPLNQYTIISLKNSSAVFENINDLSLSLIFFPERIFHDMPETIKLSSLKYKIWESSDREILRIKGKSKKELFLLILHIHKSSGLVMKWILKVVHHHGQELISNVLQGRYFNIKYNLTEDVKSLFKFSPPAGSQLVDEFDIGKYYESVKVKLNSYVGKKIQIPSFIPINFDKQDEGSETKFILLEFWATWCQICKSEIPLLNEIQEKFYDKLNIIAISFEKEKVIKKFIDKVRKNIKYNIASYKADKAIEPYKFVVQYPSAFLLDSKLKLKKVWVGEKNASQFKQYFEQLFSRGGK